MARVSQHVHRVGSAGCLRQNLLQLLHSLALEPGKLHPAPLQHIRCQNAGATCVGDDGNAAAVGQWLVGERARVAEKLLQGVHAQHACLIESCVISRLCAGQRTRMAGDRARAGLGHAALQHQDWLLAADLARHTHELRPLGHALNVGQHHARLRVICPVEHQVGLADVGLVAQADEAAEAQVLGSQRPVQDRRLERAGLRHERDVALRRRPGGEGGVQRRVRVNDAQAVRPDDANAVLLGDLDDFLLALGPFDAGFAEPGADDHHRLDALLPTLTQRRRHRVVGDHDHSQIGRLRQAQHRVIRLVAGNLCGTGVDRVDVPPEAGLDDVGQHRIAELARLRARTNDRDCVWFEKSLKHRYSQD